MPGKELRDDLSKEEIEEKRGRTRKTRMRWSKRGGRNKVKAIRKKERSRRRRSGGQGEESGLDCDENSL